MTVTNKAEAEVLSVEELKTELESRGLPTEGLKQPVMLETLLKHLEATAAPNGEVNKEAGEPNGESKESSPPENGASKEVGDSSEHAAADADADAAASEKDPVKDDMVAPGEGTAEMEKTVETTVEKTVEEDMAPAAEGAAPTRPADEVSGGTEQPGPKKAKTDADSETAELGKTSETPTETPAAESAA